MIRNLKLLGLAICAVLVFGAVGGPVASASEFHSEASHTILDGEQTANFNDKFTIDAGTVECKNITYSGTIAAATTSTASVVPTYKECISTFGSATIDPNGCEYLFHGTSSVDIVCLGATKYIAVTAFGCEVTVPAQTGIKGHITYTNHGSGSSRHITVHVTLEGITYEEHKKGFFPTCETNTVLTHNGVYHGSATIKGTTTGGAPTGIWYA